MYKNVTLNEFIAALQKLAEEHGDEELRSIGACSGKVFGMNSPYILHFEADRTAYVAAYADDVKAVPSQDKGLRGKDKGEATDLDGGELRHVWARVGMTLDITPEEEKAIFEGDYFEGKAAVKRAVMDGRASLDGETYIPEECIEDYDREYGTNYHGGPVERAWSLDGDRLHSEGFVPPCKLGDTVFVLYYNEETGLTEIDALSVTEVSEKRIWVNGDQDFGIDAIGSSVFLSQEAAEAHIGSPEYLAERVNMVLHLNVSDEAKKELLVAGFKVGQEYFEVDTKRFIRLTARGPANIWEFDVFDKNHELMYSTSEYGVRLAIDMMNGYVVPAYLQEQVTVQENAPQQVADLLANAEKRAVGSVACENEKDVELF